MKRKNKYNKKSDIIWFLVSKNGSNLSEFDIKDEIELIAFENDIYLYWYPEKIKTENGYKQLAFIRGDKNDFARFLKFVNDRMV
jgi:hypothetical protein